MISCGEPSGDLYAASLAREICPTGAWCGRHRLRRRAPARRRRRSRWRFQRIFRSPACRGRAPAPQDIRHLSPPASRTRATNRPDVFVAVDFPDFNFRLAQRGPPSRRAGRLLHQPAALGVAPRPHEDDEADRRSRAGDLSVRGGDLPEAGVSRRHGWAIPLLDEFPAPRPREAICAEQIGAGPRRTAGRAAAGKPCQRGDGRSCRR